MNNKRIADTLRHLRRTIGDSDLRKGLGNELSSVCAIIAEELDPIVLHETPSDKPKVRYDEITFSYGNILNRIATALEAIAEAVKPILITKEIQ